LNGIKSSGRRRRCPCHGQAGPSRKEIGRLDRAEEHYRQAAQLFHKQRETSALAAALTNLAEVQTRAGKPEQAEQNYSGRRTVSRRAEQPATRARSALLADVSRSLKKIDQASRFTRKRSGCSGRTGRIQAGDRVAIPGRNESSLRGQADAKMHYTEAALLYRKEDNNLGVANTLRSLGDLERRSGRFDAARSNYEEAMDCIG